MINGFSFLIYTSIFSGLFGLFILIYISTQKTEKNLSHQVSSFVIDGIKAYALRAFSSIMQVILYLSLVFLILSFVFKTPFPWTQIGAFFAGGVAMSISLYVITIFVPRLIPNICEKSKGYLKDGLHFQFNISTMIGFTVSSIIMLTLCGILYWTSLTHAIGYGVGILFASFFTRIGGGVFKASIDIGKTIAEIRNPELPHDDNRNPAVLLNITGDYISKLCGFSSDIIGSYVLSFLSCLLLITGLESQLIIHADLIKPIQQLPYIILSLGFIGSFGGFIISHLRIKKYFYSNILLEALYAALIICTVGLFFFTKNFPILKSKTVWLGFSTFNPFIAYSCGIIGAFLICYLAEVLTSSLYKNAKNVAENAEYSGAFTQLLTMEKGLKSTGLFLSLLLLTGYVSYISAGLFGISLACLGILSVTPIIISINSFSPLSSSVYNIARLSTSSKTIVDHTKKMNIIGQSTIALGNGFSILTSILASFSLFFGFVCFTETSFQTLFSLNMLWLVGLISGLTLPLFAAGYLLSSVISIAKYIIKEVKRQFDQIPYLKEGKAKPDITKAADKTARISMDGLIYPGIIIALIPIILGYVLNVSMLIGLALGTLLTGITLLFYWSVSGDLPHNAKHYIEDGHCGGSQSLPHLAIKQADLVGDIYKDVLSPCLTIFIKSVMILAVIILLIIA